MAEKCESCFKENINKVNIRRVIEKLDSFFSVNDLKGAGEFLEYWASEAKFLGDNSGLLSVLNEQIGFCRRTNEKSKGLQAVNEALELLASPQFSESASVGTIYVNCATTLKHFGFPETALSLYEKAEGIYSRYSVVDVFDKAALYNNFASTYMDLKQYDSAEKYYLLAIELLKSTGENLGETAVSYINLAHLYFEQNPFSEKINDYLDLAWEYLIDERNPKNGNYAFVCSKCAQSYGYFGQFTKEDYLNSEAKRIYEGN